MLPRAEETEEEKLSQTGIGILDGNKNALGYAVLALSAEGGRSD